MKNLLLVLLACLGACAQPVDADLPAAQAVVAPPTTPVAVQVSSRFLDFKSVEAVPAILAAVEQWNRATAGRVVLTAELADADSSVGLWLRPATAADVAAATIEPSGLGSACRGCRAGLVLLNMGLIGQRSEIKAEPAELLVEYTAMHEIGHQLGLAHAASGLMLATDRDGWQPCVDATTLAAFCAIYGCPAEAAPTCNL